jgi:hypothetical protein
MITRPRIVRTLQSDWVSNIHECGLVGCLFPRDHNTYYGGNRISESLTEGACRAPIRLPND